MTGKERFLATIRGENTDKVPIFDYLFNQDLYRHYFDTCADYYDTRKAVELTYILGLDAVWVPNGAGNITGVSKYDDENRTVFTDEWGVTYEKNNASWPLAAMIKYPIKERKDLLGFTPPEPQPESRVGPIATAVKQSNDDIALLGSSLGPCQFAWTIMGIETFCTTIYDDPDMLVELFKMANAFYLPIVKANIEAGADAIIISDDIAMNAALLVSPEHFRKYILKYLIEQVQSFKSMGVPVILHCCGNPTAVLDDLIDGGIDAWQALQRTAGVDLKEVKKQFGHRLGLLGNVDSSSTLPYGTKEDVMNETIDCIRTASPGGRYVIATDHSIHDGIPVENILAMIETGKKYGAVEN